MKPRRPHVVPRGYQRLFADGECIRVVDKTTRADRLQGTRDTFVEKGFLTVRTTNVVTDRAEDLFADVENQIFPTIRTITPDAALTPDQRAAAVTLTAMLWARSYGTEAIRQRVAVEAYDNEVNRIAASRELRRMFHREHGRGPRPGELVALVGDNWAKRLSTRQDAVESMLRHHNLAVDLLRRIPSACAGTRSRVEFITSDNPVVLAADHSMLRVGAQRGVGLAVASTIVVPLGRRTVLVFSRDQSTPWATRWLTPTEMRRVNNATWRNAARFVACHPSADWADACGVPRGRTELAGRLIELASDDGP